MIVVLWLIAGMVGYALACVEPCNRLHRRCELIDWAIVSLLVVAGPYTLVLGVMSIVIMALRAIFGVKAQ